MNQSVPHPPRRAIVSIAVAVGLVVVLGPATLSAAATASPDATAVTERTAVDDTSRVDCYPLQACVGQTSRQAGQPALTASNASNTNVFSPVSQPSVVLLVGSGILALGVLALMRLRETLLGGRGTERRSTPHRPMTDADRVEQMLLDNEGYMKQSRIVEQTDWSKAKVSRLLSRMADEGTIRKDKDGRENIIILERE